MTAAFQVDGNNDNTNSSRFKNPTIYQVVENIKLVEFNEVRREPEDTDLIVDPRLEDNVENDQLDTGN